MPDYGAVSLEEFDLLTPNQKRVLIAKDVLARVRAKKIIPVRGEYVFRNPQPRHGSQWRLRKGDEKVVDVVNEGPCQACALGSLFVAYISIKNGLNIEQAAMTGPSVTGVGDAGDWYQFRVFPMVMAERIKEIFNPLQMMMIESAFEGGGSPIGSYMNMSLEDRHAFHRIHAYRGLNDTDTLIAVMENIIANNGTFLPPLEKEDNEE